MDMSGQGGAHQGCGSLNGSLMAINGYPRGAEKDELPIIKKMKSNGDSDKQALTTNELVNDQSSKLSSKKRSRKAYTKKSKKA